MVSFKFDFHCHISEKLNFICNGSMLSLLLLLYTCKVVKGDVNGLVMVLI